MKPRTLALGAVALAATLPAVLVAGAGSGAGSAARTSAVADPTVVTLTGTLTVRGDERGWRAVDVTAEAARGRIEVNPHRWPTDNAGRYLHVGLGTSDGSRCAVDRWVVVDTTDGEAAKVYDGAGARLAETEQFTVAPAWRRQVARVGVAPFAEVDCARAASYASADRKDPGPRIWTGGSTRLEHPWSRVPLRVQCPPSTPWGEVVEIGVSLDLAPGPEPRLGVWGQPSVIGETDAHIDATSGAFTVLSSPDVPDDVDLWTAEPWSGSWVVDPDDDEVWGVRATGRFVEDEVSAGWHCRVPVSMPAPTDWTGTLAGTTWWEWEYVGHDSLGSYLLHYTYEFLDDEWVHVSREYAGARTEPCTEVARRWPWGCHRYYYDEATHRLQIDDRRARWHDRYWKMPGAPKYSVFFPGSIVLPARTGQRFRYHATSRDGELWLRRDGTFRYEGPRPGSRTQVRWTGRYRFLGGDRQQLVLRHDGRVFRDEVQLYFWQDDDGLRLFDLDTHHRQLRFRIE